MQIDHLFTKFYSRFRGFSYMKIKIGIFYFYSLGEIGSTFFSISLSEHDETLFPIPNLPLAAAAMLFTPAKSCGTVVERFFMNF